MTVSTRTGVVVALVAVIGGAVPVVAVAGADTGIAGGGDDAGLDTGADSSADGVECEYPFTVRDGTEATVTVEERPERIVTLAPGAAQTLWAFDASEKVVAVSDYATYLRGVDDREVVSERTGREYYVENITELAPDVVLAPGVVDPETVRALRSNGLTVYWFNRTRNFEDLYERTELTGRLSGECAAASGTVTDMRRRVSAVREAGADEDRPGALYTSDGFTVGNGTLIDTIMETAGTENVAAGAGSGHGLRPIDEVVNTTSHEVEWVVYRDTESRPSGDALDRTTAIRQNQTVALSYEHFAHPAPHTVVALETLTRAVHPDAYEEAQVILMTTPTATTASDDATPIASTVSTPRETTDDRTGSMPVETTEGGTEPRPEGGTETGADEDARTADGSAGTPGVGSVGTPGRATDESGSGFTVVPGVLAVLVCVLLVRRR